MKGAAPTVNTQIFRDVFDASPIGIAVETFDGQPLFVNRALCEMLGLSEEEFCSKHCVDFSPQEDAAKDWALFQQLRAGSIDHYQLEKRYFRRDGSLVWGNLSISVLNSHPSPLILAMVEDITAKKTAEEARFRHASIVESSEDAIISKNLDGIITGWNLGAELIFGYAEAEVIGRPIAILIPPELLDEENQFLEKLRAGGRIEHFETKRVTKAGYKVDVSLSIGPIKDSSGKIVGFSKIAHEITQRKQAEETLRKLNRTLEEQAALLRAREELLKIFVKNVPAGVAMLDRDMRYLQVSDRFCADFSVDSSQLLGCSHYELFPDIPEPWKEVHRRALAGETLHSDEDRWDRKCGTAWVQWKVKPWWTAEGSVGGILIFTEDITKRKQMEEALSSSSKKLIESQEQECARIGRELHDNINQRLAMLSIGLEQLQNDPLEVWSHLQELRQETLAISAEVQALSHDLHASKLQFLGAISGMRSWCKEFSKRQKIAVEFASDVSDALPFEIGLALFRVLQEALHNIVKHSGAKRAQVQIMQRATEVHLSIKDSGNGFDIEAAKQGGGLGLTSMKERLHLMNGQLSIESSPHLGTTLFARIPLGNKAKTSG
jgi:PAS domain S-box-containing protein